MHPSYSPLFTWGLLAERCMGSSFRSPVEESPSPSTTSAQPTPNDDGSVFYFTLQPSKRNTAELNSFLYLDLADHRSTTTTTTTHLRKPSTLSKRASCQWTRSANAHANSNSDLSRNEKTTTLMFPLPPPVHTRRRSSRESLRMIPSPKPAPSATLPELPITSQSPSSVPSASTVSRFSSHRASHSAPTISSSLLSPSCPTKKPSSLRSESISSHDRRKSRMDALARLEGRSRHRAPHRIARSNLRNNFMDLSDDEDEKVTTRTKSISPSKSESHPPQIVIEDLSSFADDEDETDAVSPPLPSRRRVSSSQSKTSRPQTRPPRRKRRSTIEGWFPLKSFIDFNKDDDAMSWNWRSFIEIGGVA